MISLALPPAVRFGGSPRSSAAQPLFGKKFQSIREANALFQSELQEHGVSADILWKDWGVWTITSDYNYLRVWYNPKKKPDFNPGVFTEWLGERVPQYKARMMAGETRPDAWLSIREESRCCRNGCEGCLLKGPSETPVGLIGKRQFWKA